MSGVWPYIAALIPSAGVGFLFWLVVKNMIEGDRKERLAHSQWEAAHPVEPEESGGTTNDGKTNAGNANGEAFPERP